MMKIKLLEVKFRISQGSQRISAYYKKTFLYSRYKNHGNLDYSIKTHKIMIKPEQISRNKDLSTQYKYFSDKYKDLVKYLEIKLNNQSFSIIYQNKDSIDSNSVKSWDNLLLYINQEDIGLKLKQSDILSCLNGFLSVKKQPLYALKAAKHRFWTDHWGFFLIYPECGDGHNNNRPIPSINDNFKDLSAKSIANQSLLSPNTAGGCNKTPSNDNGLTGRGFTCNNFFSPVNLYNQINLLGRSII